MFSSAPGELELDIEGTKVLALHGHRFEVSYDLYALSAYARSVNAKLCLYGHTHVPNTEYIYGIWFLNPGSASRPRSEAGRTYALADIYPDRIITDIIQIK